MVESGDVIDLSSLGRPAVDKHSTGGVGDKVTIALAPLVAACGAPCAKMSGRGLGHTGGTLDKLEAIPGFRIDLDEPEFVRQVDERRLRGRRAVRPARAGRPHPLRPARRHGDGALAGLIATSVMSKKLAAGAEAILLDVKVGDGAFVATVEEARELAQPDGRPGHARRPPRGLRAHAHGRAARAGGRQRRGGRRGVRRAARRGPGGARRPGARLRGRAAGAGRVRRRRGGAGAGRRRDRLRRRGRGRGALGRGAGRRAADGGHAVGRPRAGAGRRAGRRAAERGAGRLRRARHRARNGAARRRPRAQGRPGRSRGRHRAGARPRRRGRAGEPIALGARARRRARPTRPRPRCSPPCASSTARSTCRRSSSRRSTPERPPPGAAGTVRR